MLQEVRCDHIPATTLTPKIEKLKISKKSRNSRKSRKSRKSSMIVKNKEVL